MYALAEHPGSAAQHELSMNDLHTLDVSGVVESACSPAVQPLAVELAFWRRTALELYAEQHKLQLPLRERYIEEMLRLRAARPPKAELFEGCTAEEQALLIAYEMADGGGA